MERATTTTTEGVPGKKALPNYLVFSFKTQGDFDI